MDHQKNKAIHNLIIKLNKRCQEASTNFLTHYIVYEKVLSSMFSFFRKNQCYFSPIRNHVNLCTWEIHVNKDSDLVNPKLKYYKISKSYLHNLFFISMEISFFFKSIKFINGKTFNLNVVFYLKVTFIFGIYQNPFSFFYKSPNNTNVPNFFKIGRAVFFSVGRGTDTHVHTYRPVLKTTFFIRGPKNR